VLAQSRRYYPDTPGAQQIITTEEENMNLQEFEKTMRRVALMEANHPLLAASGSAQSGGMILPTEFNTAAETLVHRLSDGPTQHDAPAKPSFEWI